MNFFRSIRLFALIEPTAYQMHHYPTDLDALHQFQMIVLQITIIIMDVLVGMAKQGAEHHDSPRNLKP